MVGRGGRERGAQPSLITMLCELPYLKIPLQSKTVNRAGFWSITGISKLLTQRAVVILFFYNFSQAKQHL